MKREGRWAIAASCALVSAALAAVASIAACKSPTGAPSVSTGAPATSSSGKLDCAWITDRASCWRSFTRGVGDCLGARGEALVGGLSGDGVTCAGAAPGAPMMVLGKPIPPAGPDGAREAWDFSLVSGARACLQFKSTREGEGERTHAETTLVTREGVLTIVEHGLAIDLTCPGGARFRLDPSDATIDACLTDDNAAGIPLARVARTPDGIALMVSGVQIEPTFVCQTTR